MIARMIMRHVRDLLDKQRIPYFIPVDVFNDCRHEFILELNNNVIAVMEDKVTIVWNTGYASRTIEYADPRFFDELKSALHRRSIGVINV